MPEVKKFDNWSAEQPTKPGKRKMMFIPYKARRLEGVSSYETWRQEGGNCHKEFLLMRCRDNHTTRVMTEDDSNSETGVDTQLLKTKERI